MNNYYDDIENMDADKREQSLMQRLPSVLQYAKDNASAIAEQLKGIQIQSINCRQSLQQIPVMRKNDLLRIQMSHHQDRNPGDGAEKLRAFGGFSSIGWGQARRVFSSLGPIYQPESTRADYWGFARALYAAGFRQNDLIHNCFSYHLTPAGSMVETAGHALGCTVFPGGDGQTEQQVISMLNLAPNGYAGKPSFLRTIMEKALEMGEDLSIKKALFSGEDLSPSLYAWFKERGVDGYQAYSAANLGLIAYESSAKQGLIVNEDLIVEIVKPGTNQAVADGEVGEVVVTTFNPDYPLIRFGTGDLSAILPGESSCGRTNLIIKGVVGKADQTIKFRGVFVHPDQINKIVKRHDYITNARLEVKGEVGNDNIVLKIASNNKSQSLIKDIENTVREVIKLQTEIVLIDADQIPNDGKVIDDLRTYE